jgi:tetratricopeptide (TPR) repeat protein
VDQARALALAPPRGVAAIDGLIGRMQRSAIADPRKADLWIGLGQAWIRKARQTADAGYYAHAEGCARVALQVDPDSISAHDLHAMVLLNDHRFADARDAAQRILVTRNDDPPAYATLSDALVELGQVEAAAEAVDTMMGLKPTLPAYSRAAYLRWLTGDAAGAKSLMLRAMDAGDARDPEPLAWVLVQAAMIFWHEGDYDGADAGFDRALSVFADFAPALVGKGRVAMAKGDGLRAAAWFERAYGLSPLAETAWLLGDAWSAADRKEASRAAYELAKAEGKRADARTLALFLATKNQDPAEALRLAESELRVRGDVYTHDVLAWTLYRNGRTAEAKLAATRATQWGTRDARILYHAGAIFLAAGDKQQGEKLLHSALALNPKFDYSGAVDAQRLLRLSARENALARQ